MSKAKGVRREISTVRDIWKRKDTGKKTTEKYAKANPKNVFRSHEPATRVEYLR